MANNQKKSKHKRGCRARFKVQKKKRPVGEGIFNLSGVKLTRMEMAVLDKGLKFAPKRNLNKFGKYSALIYRKYTRKLNIQKYMMNRPPSSIRIAIQGNTIWSQVRNKSYFYPSNTQ